MSNPVLVTGPNPPPLAVNVYPVPVLFSLRSVKVATPPTPATGVVPINVAPPGLLARAMLTDPVNPDARFPSLSSARILTAGEIWCPATAGLGSIPNTSCVAVPGVMLNEPLVAVLKPVAVAVSQYPLPVLSRVRSPKLATPFTAATVVVPPSVLPPGLLPNDTVTLPVKVGTRLFAASSAVSCTAGLIAIPATVFDGCTVKASWVAAPGVMSNPLLVTGAKPAALAVSMYPVAVLLRLRSPNVATPPTAVTSVVPLSVAPPGLLASAMLTDPVKPDARFPSASSARIFTAGEIWCPATAVLGSVPNTSCVAVPGVMLNEPLVAVLKPVAVAVSQ